MAGVILNCRGIAGRTSTSWVLVANPCIHGQMVVMVRNVIKLKASLAIGHHATAVVRNRILNLHVAPLIAAPEAYQNRTPNGSSVP
jgi:hypothetical protein